MEAGRPTETLSKIRGLHLKIQKRRGDDRSRSLPMTQTRIGASIAACFVLMTTTAAAGTAEYCRPYATKSTDVIIKFTWLRLYAACIGADGNPAAPSTAEEAMYSPCAGRDTLCETTWFGSGNRFEWIRARNTRLAKMVQAELSAELRCQARHCDPGNRQSRQASSMSGLRMHRTHRNTEHGISRGSRHLPGG